MEQKIGDQMVAVAVPNMLHDAGIDHAHAHRFQMMLHGKEVPHTPDEFQAGQIGKIHAVRMVERMVGTHVDANALFALGNKFQFLMGENMLKCASLLFCHIDNADLGDSLVDMVGDLFHRAFMVLNMDGGPPCLIEIHQQAGRHVAGICGQAQIVLLVRYSQR